MGEAHYPAHPRDLIANSPNIKLEGLGPKFLLAGWRDRDRNQNPFELAVGRNTPRPLGCWPSLQSAAKAFQQRFNGRATSQAGYLGKIGCLNIPETMIELSRNEQDGKLQVVGHVGNFAVQTAESLTGSGSFCQYARTEKPEKQKKRSNSDPFFGCGLTPDYKQAIRLRPEGESRSKSLFRSY